MPRIAADEARQRPDAGARPDQDQRGETATGVKAGIAPQEGPDRIAALLDAGRPVPASAAHLESDSHWQKLAIAALIEEIYGHQLVLSRQVLNFADGKWDPEKAIMAWTAKNQAAVEPTDQLLSELWATEIDDLSMIAVASRSLSIWASTRSCLCRHRRCR